MAGAREELARLRADVERLHHVRRRRATVEDSIRVATDRLKALRRERDEAERHRRAVRRFGPTRLWRALRGRQGRMMREADIRLAIAGRRVPAEESAVAALERRLRALASEEARFADAEERYRRGVQVLASSSGLPDLEEQARLHAVRLEEIREIDEAVAAAVACGREAQKLSDLLGRAKAVGIFDIVAGGLIVSAWKSGILNHADEQARVVHQKVELLRAELRDVPGMTESDLQVGLGSVWHFVDVFIDGIIVDLITQSRINQTVDRVEEFRRALDTLQADLKRRGREARAGAGRLVGAMADGLSA